MKRINLPAWLFVLTLTASLPAVAASLFDEPDKDAASALQLTLEKDRQMQAIENRKYIQTQQDYQNSRIEELYQKIHLLEGRVAELEMLVGNSREKKTKS